MSPSARQLLGFVFACVVAYGIIVVVDALALSASSLPPGTDPTDPHQLRVLLEAGRIPFSALLLELGGWILAAYVGCRLARQVGRLRRTAVLFTVALTAYVAVALASVPHPVWMWIGGLGGVPLVALGSLGTSITVRAR